MIIFGHRIFHSHTWIYSEPKTYTRRQEGQEYNLSRLSIKTCWCGDKFKYEGHDVIAGGEIWVRIE